MTQLPPGKYNISVEKVGFKKLEKTEINLNATDLASAGDFVLEVGEVTETVTVTAETARVEIQSESGERSGLVTGTQLRDLAINGRNYQDFLRTVPGVLASTVPAARLRHRPAAWQLFGQWHSNNQKELTVDRSSDIDTGNNVDTHAAVNPDAVAEVKVLTANFQAEYGRAGGAFISVVTKSEPRTSGNLRYFHRNEGLNANNYFRNALGRRPTALRFNRATSTATMTKATTSAVQSFFPKDLRSTGGFNQKNKLFFTGIRSGISSSHRWAQQYPCSDAARASRDFSRPQTATGTRYSSGSPAQRQL